MCADQAETSTVMTVSAADPEGSPGISRRGLLGMSAATAFLFGFHVPIVARSHAAEGSAFVPNAFIRIDDQGDVTLIMPQVEMGQGTYTSISMILALRRPTGLIACTRYLPSQMNHDTMV